MATTSKEWPQRSCRRIVPFCDRPLSPTKGRPAGVQNPCPQSTSHNRPCRRVVRRSAHGPPARLRPRLHHRPATHLQVDALERAGCYRVFTETASGAHADRPTLAQLLDQLRPGDTLVVWKLDRLGRSLRHLVDTVTGLAERGIGFRSLQGFAAQVNRSERLLTSRFTLPCCPLLSPRFR
jgi:hypothetical protein